MRDDCRVPYLGRQFAHVYGDSLLEGCILGLGEVQVICADLDTGRVNAGILR